MAIFHCHIKIGSRGAGRSAAAASAYRAGEKIHDRETGLTHDFTRKGGVVFSEVLLPKNAPREFMDRETLWNSAQAAERQKNGQLFREIELALPVEMTRQQQIEAVWIYAQKNFVDEGMCVDWALHDKGDGNPHAHLMLTTRSLDENGAFMPKRVTEYALDENGERIPAWTYKKGANGKYLKGADGKKILQLDDNGNPIQRIGARGRRMWQRVEHDTNNWNDPGNAELWREAWARTCNRYLDANNQIDHRSFARRGIDRAPTIHEGYAAREMERRGRTSERCQINREIRALNEARRIVNRYERDLIVAMYRQQRDQSVTDYLNHIHGRNNDERVDQNKKQSPAATRGTAGQSDERRRAADPVRRTNKPGARRAGRGAGRGPIDVGSARSLSDMSFFDLDAKAAGADLFLSDPQRDRLEVERPVRLRDTGVQRTGAAGAGERADRVQRQIDAIRRRKRAEKRDAEKRGIGQQTARISATGSQIDAIRGKRAATAQYQRGVSDVMTALQTGAQLPEKIITSMLPDDVKKVYSAAKKILTMPLDPKNLLPHNMIKTAFSALAECAKAGDKSAGAFLQNPGSVPKKIMDKWDLLSVAERDEMRAKSAYMDEWPEDRFTSPMQQGKNRGKSAPVQSEKAAQEQRVKFLTR